jgi:hypothetical protein
MSDEQRCDFDEAWQKLQVISLMYRYHGITTEEAATAILAVTKDLPLPKSRGTVVEDE